MSEHLRQVLLYRISSHGFRSLNLMNQKIKKFDLNAKKIRHSFIFVYSFDNILIKKIKKIECPYGAKLISDDF